MAVRIDRVDNFGEHPVRITIPLELKMTPESVVRIANEDHDLTLHHPNGSIWVKLPVRLDGTDGWTQVDGVISLRLDKAQAEALVYSACRAAGITHA